MKKPSDGLEILIEDEDLVGLVKPAGLPTANAARGDESVFTLLQRRFRPGAFVGIVSRLDAPVSGVVVVAKTRPAAAHLAEQFRNRAVEKAYGAVVEGRFPAPLGQWLDWHDAISRRPDERRSVLHRPAGPLRTQDDRTNIPLDDDDDEGDAIAARPAHVRARVVRRAGEVSLVELEPSTGRRHQLRLQLAARGCPIVGDRLYGARLPYPGGIALHARRLRLSHPRTEEPLVLEAAWPGEWGRRFPALFPGSGRS